MNVHHTRSHQQAVEVSGGYAALMSVLLVSGILLLVVSVSSYRGYFSRYNLLQSEFKERSLALAEACADEALLSLARDRNYLGNVSLFVGAEPCRIGPVTSSVTTTNFRTKASFKSAYTTIQISVNTETLVVVSWEEIANGL